MSDQKQSAFEQCVMQTSRRIGKLWAALRETENCITNNTPEKTFDCAMTLAEEAEKFTLLTRALPAYTGNPLALDKVDEMVNQTIPVKIGFTENGWFYLCIPALLPKKGKGSPSYIRAFLYPAMRRFFHGKAPTVYPDCVLVFRHVYQRDRPERQYRDHDNIELNMVADIVAFHVMKDDTPLRCSHYYCSAAGAVDQTEVFVVPQIEFMSWLQFNQSRCEEEVIVHENR